MIVLLTWPAVTNASFYNVYRSVTTGGPYTKFATNITGLTYTDGPGNLAQGIDYYYVVTSTDVDGDESVYSNEYHAVPLPATAAPVLTGSIT